MSAKCPCCKSLPLRGSWYNSGVMRGSSQVPPNEQGKTGAHCALAHIADAQVPQLLDVPSLDLRAAIFFPRGFHPECSLSVSQLDRCRHMQDLFRLCKRDGKAWIYHLQ